MGKLHAMTWMLVGLVLTSLVIGNVSSIFSIDFVYKPQSFDATGKVSKIHEIPRQVHESHHFHNRQGSVHVLNG